MDQLLGFANRSLPRFPVGFRRDAQGRFLLGAVPDQRLLSYMTHPTAADGHELYYALPCGWNRQATGLDLHRGNRTALRQVYGCPTRCFGLHLIAADGTARAMLAANISKGDACVSVVRETHPFWKRKRPTPGQDVVMKSVILPCCDKGS